MAYTLDFNEVRRLAKVVKSEDAFVEALTDPKYSLNEGVTDQEINDAAETAFYRLNSEELHSVIAANRYATRKAEFCTRAVKAYQSLFAR